MAAIWCCACTIICIIWAGMVSEPTRSKSIFRIVLVLSVAPMTVSPMRLPTGISSSLLKHAQSTSSARCVRCHLPRARRQGLHRLSDPGGLIHVGPIQGHILMAYQSINPNDGQLLKSFEHLSNAACTQGPAFVRNLLM